MLSVFHKVDLGGFSFKSIVLQDYWELEAHIYTSKTSDSGPKRLTTIFGLVANKYFPRGITTVKVIFPTHGNRVVKYGTRLRSCRLSACPFSIRRASHKIQKLT